MAQPIDPRVGKSEKTMSVKLHTAITTNREGRKQELVEKGPSRVITDWTQKIAKQTQNTNQKGDRLRCAFCNRDAQVNFAVLDELSGHRLCNRHFSRTWQVARDLVAIRHPELNLAKDFREVANLQKLFTNVVIEEMDREFKKANCVCARPRVGADER
jgi:hypothetical protein